MATVWYRTGSVSVANGSATVTGVDTTDADGAVVIGEGDLNYIAIGE